MGFAKVVVTRAGRLQERSQGELRLYTLVLTTLLLTYIEKKVETHLRHHAESLKFFQTIYLTFSVVNSRFKQR